MGADAPSVGMWGPWPDYLIVRLRRSGAGAGEPCIAMCTCTEVLTAGHGLTSAAEVNLPLLSVTPMSRLAMFPRRDMENVSKYCKTDYGRMENWEACETPPRCHGAAPPVRKQPAQRRSTEVNKGDAVRRHLGHAMQVPWDGIVCMYLLSQGWWG